MNNNIRTLLLAFAAAVATGVHAQKQWTLQQCIDYAMENNIQLQKLSLQKQSSVEDMKQSKAQLLPSLNFSTNQNVTFRPWPMTGAATVAGGYVQSSIDKTYYNGSYSVSANWTVWNGNRNHNQVKLNQMNADRADVDSTASARTIEEQIMQYYIQILYTKENVGVMKQSLESARINEDRGREMLSVGKMSKADLAQLSAQRAQDEYNVVQAQSSERSLKRQLKMLLQITNDEDFDVADMEATDDMALTAIPAMNDVYLAAIEHRPEMQSAQMQIETAQLQKKIAKAQRLPTIGLSASAGTNTTSMNSNAWGRQLKTNFDVAGGINVQVPLFDQRQTRTAVNKAEISRLSAVLDLRDKQTSLHSTIEDYWIQAQNNQNQFRSARESTASAEASYELLSEQFRLGLRNIVELQEGKNRLLSAKQSELQSKYMTILCIKMLEFYRK